GFLLRHRQLHWEPRCPLYRWRFPIPLRLLQFHRPLPSTSWSRWPRRHFRPFSGALIQILPYLDFDCFLINSCKFTEKIASVEIIPNANRESPPVSSVLGAQY